MTFKRHNLIDSNPMARHSRRVSFLLQNRGFQKERKKQTQDHFALLSPQQNSCFCHILKSCLFSNISGSLEPFSLHKKTVSCFGIAFKMFLTLSAPK